jgi:hypothetical protein
VVVEDEPDILVEEAVIFLHRFLHNVGEPQAAESFGLMQESRVRRPSFLLTKPMQNIGRVEKAGRGAATEAQGGSGQAGQRDQNAGEHPIEVGRR